MVIGSSVPGTPEAADFVKERVAWGAGPRASQYLVLASKARALLRGRLYVASALGQVTGVVARYSGFDGRRFARRRVVIPAIAIGTASRVVRPMSPSRRSGAVAAPTGSRDPPEPDVIHMATAKSPTTKNDHARSIAYDTKPRTQSCA